MSFARLLAEAGGFSVVGEHWRIAWLLEPRDGSDTFLTIPAELLLAPGNDAGANSARSALKGKVVIIGGLFIDLDRHGTPLTARMGELQPGALIHAQMTAELIDGRGGAESDPLLHPIWLGVTFAMVAFGLLIGLLYSHVRRGILLGRWATVVILVLILAAELETIFLPGLLFLRGVEWLLLAWLVGEVAGHQLGRFVGWRPRAFSN